MHQFVFRLWGTWLVLGAAAHGAVIVTLEPGAVTAMPGQSITVFGSVGNNTGVEVFLTGVVLNTQSPLQGDPSIFFTSAAPYVSPGFSISGSYSTPSLALFDVLIPFGTPLGVYTVNDFRLQGGLASGDGFDIASTGFQVTVVTPEPEPGWLLLVGLVILFIARAK